MQEHDAIPRQNLNIKPMKSPLGLFIFLLVLGSLLACEKSSLSTNNSTSLETFAGRWENTAAQANGLTRLTITQKIPGQISVQLWRSCGPDNCNLGNYSSSINDLEDGILLLPLTWNDIPIEVELSLTESGRLEAKTTSSTAANFQTQRFTRTETNSFFQQIDIADARSVNLSPLRINGSNSELNFLRPGTIIVYQSNEGRYGKIQIRGNDDILTMRWNTWDTDGVTYQGDDFLSLKGNTYYDIDLGKEDLGEAKSLSDFLWIDKGKSERWLEPVNEAKMAVYHLGAY